MIQQTSLLAYTEIRQNDLVLTQSYVEIIEALKLNGAMTDRELAYFLHYSDPNKVRPRRNELMKAGIITHEFKETCKITGKMAIKWRLTNVKY